MSTARGAERPDPRAVERVGVFGGTFDPPHVGHVGVAAEVADVLALDRVLWVPAGASPFKPEGAEAPPQTRLEMVRAAIEADPRFAVVTDELERPAPSFTVDTLEGIRARRPDASLHLMVGTDQFRVFPKWRDPGRIARLARLAVMSRGDEDAEPLVEAVVRAVPALDGRVDVVRVRPFPHSSTAIRAAVRRGAPLEGLVPAPVSGIIVRRALYRA